MNKNLPFTSTTKMADVIHRDYRLIPIINRFDIEYGFGNKTVAEVCKMHQINVWFFLEMINTYHNPEYFPKKQLQNFSANHIIQYLSNTHAYYLDTKIPEIQNLIDGMEKEAININSKNIKLLNDFFKEYKNEIKKHFNHEEYEVFPYILELEMSLENKKSNKELVQRILNDPIEKYERNHDNLETKLGDLKNLIIKFLPPVLCKSLCQLLLTELFRLEQDLNNHTLIEDKVLIPKVKLLEQKFIDANGE